MEQTWRLFHPSEPVIAVDFKYIKTSCFPALLNRTPPPGVPSACTTPFPCCPCSLASGMSGTSVSRSY